MNSSSRQSRDGLSFLSDSAVACLRCVPGVNTETELGTEKEFPKKANPLLCRLWLRGASCQLQVFRTGNSLSPRSRDPSLCVTCVSGSQICKLGGGSHNLSRLNCPLSHSSSPSHLSRCLRLLLQNPIFLTAV